MSCSSLSSLSLSAFFFSDQILPAKAMSENTRCINAKENKRRHENANEAK
ncbi:hypothetical protein CAMRE0001_1288 [Campylobacter rectus RM3267]|uniref:Uncharacterized protein n=1 Tax=Campylobacter rectus RM3267 TaxID=553218 RepID=B9CZY0_CAMRE|nr:hypothetical protein CAMRE0001_1288 [Campylobacter rectus RM3267]